MSADQHSVNKVYSIQHYFYKAQSQGAITLKNREDYVKVRWWVNNHFNNKMAVNKVKYIFDYINCIGKSYKPITKKHYYVSFL